MPVQMTLGILDIFFIFFIFIFLSYQYKKINHSIVFSPLTPPLLVFSITGATIIVIHRLGFIEEHIFYILMIEYFIYFIFISVTPHLIKKKYIKLSDSINIKHFDKQIVKILFYVSTAIGILYIAILWSMYSSGSDRFILNKSMRPLMLLNQLFSVWVLAMSSIIYSKTKTKKFLYYAIITIILSGFMGSRAAAVVGLLLFLFYYLQFNTISKKYFKYIISISVLLIFLPTYFMYNNAVEMLINRVVLSADIYLWSFVIGDYKELIGFYEPLSYFLHPFTSLVGIRGYDFPFGAQIISTANLEPDGTGPQDHMLMLGLLFFSDCFYCIILFTIFFALLTMLSLIFIFYFFSKTRIPLSLRVLVFTLLYARSIAIFVGVNAYSFNIVIAIMGIVVYSIFDFLKIISVKKKEV